MTRKEILRKDITELLKNYEELTGEKFNSGMVSRRISEKSTTVAELEYAKKTVEDAISVYKTEQKVEKFWKTEQGAEIKARLEAERTKIHNRIDELLRRRENAFTWFIQCLLGKGWECTSVDDYYIRFEAVKDGKHVFGSDIEVTYRMRSFHDEVSGDYGFKKTVEYNVGTMGSFGLGTDRAKFYMDFAKFLEGVDEKMLTEKMSYYAALLKNEKEELEDIEKRLKDPFSWAKESKQGVIVTDTTNGEELGCFETYAWAIDFVDTLISMDRRDGNYLPNRYEITDTNE